MIYLSESIIKQLKNIFCSLKLNFDGEIYSQSDRLKNETNYNLSIILLQ